MKYRILGLIALALIAINIRVSAANSLDVNVQVNGKIDKGEKIEILININNINSFFAGAVEFKYDSRILKVTSIEGGSLINQNNINKFEAIKKIDEGKSTASYGFSCLGKINGYSGSGTFVKINAEIIEKGDFSITSKPFIKEPTKDYNLKLQVCDSDIKELDYNFNGFTFKNINTDSLETITQAGNENITTPINKDDSVKKDNPDDKNQSVNNNSSSNIIANTDNNQSSKESSNKPETATKNLKQNSMNNSNIIISCIIILILLACFSFLYIKRKTLTRK